MPIITRKPVHKTSADEKFPNATDALELFDAFLQVERRRLVERLRKAREQARRIYGRCEGQKPYGHYPDEAAIYASMLNMRLDGMSSPAIAFQLNRQELKSRTGKPWSAAVVARILRRELTPDALRSSCAERKRT